MRATVYMLPLLALAACGHGDRQNTVGLLQHRLHTRLAASIQNGSAVVQDLPSGARVVFPDTATQAVDPRTDLVEAMIDPSLLRIGIAAPSNLTPGEAIWRVQTWQTYLGQLPLNGAVISPEVAPAGSPPSAMAVTLAVVCPDHHDEGNEGTGYNDGTRKPDCF